MLFSIFFINKKKIKKAQKITKKIQWSLEWHQKQIEEVSSDECDYEKDYMKIKFNSDDELPLSKPLKFHLMTITIRFVFEEDAKLYPQVFLDDTLYELNV